MPEKIRLVTRGIQIAEEQLRRYPVMAVGNGLPEKNTVFAFDSKQAFNNWAKGTRFAERVSRANKLIAEARKYEKADNAAARERQKAVVDRILKDLNELSRRTGLEPNSKELFLKATVERHPLEGSIFDAALLFERQCFFGRCLPIVGAFPDLGWFGFDDKTSSMLLLFGGLFFEHTWFRGRCIWINADPILICESLWGWDNIISSACSI